MRILDKISVILFNFALLFASIIILALILASSPSYYHMEFEKNDMYGTVTDEGETNGRIIYYIGGDRSKRAVFSNQQLDRIADHIIDYLFGDTESFELTLDEVYIVGEGYADGVDIFGDTAVLHMGDVRTLMRFALVMSVICAISAAALLVMFILRSKTIERIALKYTLIFYAAIATFAIGFCAYTLISGGADWFSYNLWTNIHHLLFPFQPEKFENSFFNDTLTEILCLELFLDAVLIVVSITATVLAAWFIGAMILRKRTKPE